VHKPNSVRSYSAATSVCMLYSLLGVTKLSEPASAGVSGILLLSSVVHAAIIITETRSVIILINVTQAQAIATAACNLAVTTVGHMQY
jgi:hypothetical protein